MGNQKFLQDLEKKLWTYINKLLQFWLTIFIILMLSYEITFNGISIAEEYKIYNYLMFSIRLMVYLINEIQQKKWMKNG